ncbi:MAG: hypothetical protein CVU18_02065 [Betaproteobacteria bacterium HGW-Betaproteobacteria-12]|nr:MAG: hypothetical protein CVU18_02065 [Betaproteobacteria bacterium HGW-Betaproteobacteria-12]
MRKPRHAGQKISLALSIICAVMTLPSFAIFVWLWQTRGLADTWTPSLLAVVAFFAFCAAVCYAMSVPQPILPDEEAPAGQ